MGTPYAVQLADKQSTVRAALADLAPDCVWLDPFAGPDSGFRNKAKLVVGGSRGAPVLGILDAGGAVADLTGCGLYEPGLREAVLALPEVVARTGLTPYDVGRRSGELKHVLVTHSPDDELLVRFVLRSPGQLPRVREALDLMRDGLPGTRVVSANLLPEHKAVLEGAEEVVLTAADTLPMRVDGVVLHLRPQSFFQTNTTVAAGLYRQVTHWICSAGASTMWDLYCGVGGFALHALASGVVSSVVGVEVSEQAVLSARRTVAALAPDTATADFRVGDATALGGPGTDNTPDLVVVNPPRRGIGPELAAQLDRFPGPGHVVYSSCNVTTLAADLAAMPSFMVRAARLFDMFPQTGHHEVAVLLERR